MPSSAPVSRGRAPSYRQKGPSGWAPAPEPRLHPGPSAAEICRKASGKFGKRVIRRGLLMDTLIQVIQEPWMAYAGLAASALPLMFIFRRFVFPAIWYAVEIAFYLASMHTLLHFIVRLLRWFKYESTFGALGEKVDTGWQTPLFEF